MDERLTGMRGQREKNYNRKEAAGNHDFKERRNQQERERVVGGEDFKVSMRALSMRETQKGESDAVEWGEGQWSNASNVFIRP